MAYFLLGVLCSLVMVVIFLRYYLNSFKTIIQEYKYAKQSLETLYLQCMQVSDDMVKDLDVKITEGKEVLAQIEEQKEIYQQNKDKENKDSVQTKRTKSKINNRKNSKENFEFKLNPIQENIIKMAQAGKTVKEISQNLGIGQDQVTMVLQLFK